MPGGSFGFSLHAGSHLFPPLASSARSGGVAAAASRGGHFCGAALCSEKQEPPRCKPAVSLPAPPTCKTLEQSATALPFGAKDTGQPQNCCRGSMHDLSRAHFVTVKRQQETSCAPSLSRFGVVSFQCRHATRSPGCVSPRRGWPPSSDVRHQNATQRGRYATTELASVERCSRGKFAITRQKLRKST